MFPDSVDLQLEERRSASGASLSDAVLHVEVLECLPQRWSSTPGSNEGGGVLLARGVLGVILAEEVVVVLLAEEVLLVLLGSTHLPFVPPIASLAHRQLATQLLKVLLMVLATSYSHQRCPPLHSRQWPIVECQPIASTACSMGLSATSSQL